MGSSLFKFHKIFMIIGFLFGVLLTVLIPFGTGFDEKAHLSRIYDISGLHLLPNQGEYEKTVSYSEFYTLSYRRSFLLNKAFSLFSPEVFLARPDYNNMSIEETGSIYPPIMFLPQAIIAGICWRFLDLPIIPVTILLRLVGLFVYLFGCYLAIKNIPVGKWLLFTLALTPTALYQASTVNADGFTNAISFVFIAYVLFISLREKKIISTKELVTLCGLILLLSGAKPGAIVILPLLLIIPSYKYSTKTQKAILIIAVVLAVAFELIWMAVASRNSKFDEGGRTDLLSQITLIVGQPEAFIKWYFEAIKNSFFATLSSWVAAYGYWVGVVPAIVYWLFPIPIIIAFICDQKHDEFNIRKRAFVFIIFIFSVFITYFLFAIPRFSPETTGSLPPEGRYFIAFSPLLFLIFINWKEYDFSKLLLIRLSIITTCCILGFYIWGLFATYYTDCGRYIFTKSLCKLPAYQNLEIDEAQEVILTKRQKIEQQFWNTCGRIETIEIVVTRVSNDASGKIRLSLVDDYNKTISVSELDIKNIKPSSRLVFDIKQNEGLMKGNYIIALETSDLTGQVGLALTKPGPYPGNLPSHQTTGGEVIFYYYCSKTGLFSYTP